MGGVINGAEYDTKAKRKELLRKLKKSWSSRPICASVAVMCWQQYLAKVSGNADEAAQLILKYAALVQQVHTERVGEILDVARVGDLRQLRRRRAVKNSAAGVVAFFLRGGRRDDMGLEGPSLENAMCRLEKK